MVDLRKAKITKEEELDSSDAKWVQLNILHYVDPEGTARTWESASRKTRVKGAECDGVGIIALIHKPEGTEIVLQRQYRAPINGVCIEIPAGLLDPRESLEECALRELIEETGYYGSVVSSSPPIFNDPGFCNTNLSLVTVTVDLKDPRNQNPVPKLEPEEFIETFTVPLKDLPSKIAEFHANGFKLDARVQNIAAGIEVSKYL